MYRTFSSLFLLLAGLLSYAQPSIPEVSPYTTKETPAKVLFLSAPEHQSHLMILQGELGKRTPYAHWIHENEGVGTSIKLTDSKSPFAKILQKDGIKGYSYTGPNTFQVYLFNDQKRELYRYQLEVDSTDGTATQEIICTLGKKERFLGSINQPNEFIFTTIELYSSRLHVYRVPIEGTYTHFEYDLGKESMGARRFQTLYEVIVTQEIKDSNLPFYALGLVSPTQAHIFGAIQSFDNKLYLDGSNLWLTLDGESTYTLLIGMPLTGDEASVSRLDAGFAPCESQGYPRKAKTFLHQGQLWQLKGCDKGLYLRIYDTQTTDLIYEEEMGESDLASWSAGTPVNRGSILPQLLVGAVRGPKFKDEKLTTYLNQYPPNLSIIPHNGDSLEVMMRVYGENRGLQALTALGSAGLMIGMGAATGVVANVAVNPNSFGKSMVYKALCDPQSFQAGQAPAPVSVPTVDLTDVFAFEKEQRGYPIARFDMGTYLLGVKAVTRLGKEGYLVYTYPKELLSN